MTNIKGMPTSSKQLRRITSKRSSQQRGREAETKIPGKLVPASGAIPGLKGDVVQGTTPCGTYLVESKSTDKKSLSITLTILRKITREALQRALIPLVKISVQEEEWYIVPKNVWEGMLDE